ncbi:MAG: DUF3017 domain-containing protein [Candidatus Nanopelagicales bacterium]
MSTASGDEYLVGSASPATVEIATLPSKPRRWPFLVVLAVGLVGLGLIATGLLQQGVVALIVAFGVAALLRLVLPGRGAGLLASRTRVLDACGFAALAAAMAATLLLIK